eukprot:SAG31_NODE_1120_length_9805_cov_8.220173_4_plen_76_part_00
MPAPPFKIEISDEETNKLLDLTWDQFMNHMAEGYYISDVRPPCIESDCRVLACELQDSYHSCSCTLCTGCRSASS